MWEYLNKLIKDYPLIKSFITILTVSASYIYYRLFPHKKLTYKNHKNKINEEFKKTLNKYNNQLISTFYSVYEHSKDYKGRTLNSQVPCDLNVDFQNINHQFTINKEYFEKSFIEVYNLFAKTHDTLIQTGVISTSDGAIEFVNNYKEMLKIIETLGLKCKIVF